MPRVSCKKGGKPTEGTIRESDTGGPKAKINIFSPDLPASSIILTRAKPLPDRPLQSTAIQGNTNLSKTTSTERLDNYNKVRARIFGSIQSNCPKRSTQRMRKFWRTVRHTKRILVSSIINKENDSRFYAKISFLGRTAEGLLDTGANVSCVGSTLAAEQWEQVPEFKKIKSSVRTTDSRSHEVDFFLQ